MPKPLQLKPYKTPREGASWCLDIPEYLSETGKRQRKFFDTQKEAETAAEILKARRANFGNTLSLLSPERITEAAQAYKLLDANLAKVSLLSVVQAHLRHEKVRTASQSFEELFDLYLKENQGNTEAYLYKLEKTKERFPKLRHKLVCDITHEDLEPVLYELRASMRNSEMRHLKAVFKLGIKKGYLESNPVERLSFAKLNRKEVETIPVAIAEKMLLYSLQIDWELFPFLVLGFFCGCRPNGELEKIEWRDVSIADKVLTIRSDVSKTPRKRFVDLSENACAWLQVYLNNRKSLPSPSTKIVPFTFHILRKKRRMNWLYAREGRMRWIHQGMRHTFCSCWLVKHGDVNRLVLQSGHTSPEIMWRSYHRGVTREEAEKFWSIMPPKQVEQKIVAFPAAS
jgi:integrase